MKMRKLCVLKKLELTWELMYGRVVILMPFRKDHASCCRVKSVAPVAVNRRQTDNTMANRKRTKKQF
jgi:hypothetical protein